MALKLKKFFILGFIFLHFSGPASAQNYGNEWIEWDKLHIRIKVWEEKVYRIGFFSLDQHYTEAGLYLAGIPFEQFALYNLGSQVPVYVYDQNGNNRFDPLDYIEFVGHKADGSIDKELFLKPEYQRHNLTNFYSDTNYYFLTTRTGGANLRYSAFSGSALAQARPYHLSRYVFLNERFYNEGDFIMVGDKQSFYSDYTNGEGFYGDQFLASSNLNDIRYTVELNMQGYYPGGPAPEVESGVIAFTTSNNPANPNNRMRVYVSPDLGGRRLISDTLFYGVKPVTYRFRLDSADVKGEKSYVMYNPILPSGFTFGFWGHSHTTVRYPRVYNFSDSSIYSYEEDTTAVPRSVTWKRYGDGLAKKPVFYDEVNRKRWTGNYDAGTGNVTCVNPPMPALGKIMAIDAERIEILSMVRCAPVKPINYTTHINNAEYLMITHPKLIGPRGEVENYKKFWEKKYIVQLSLVNDLYDYFSYGFPHPLAIRHYCKYLLDKSTPAAKPQFLLLLGRGYDYQYNKGIYRQHLTPFYQKNNLIPTIGHPVSDWMFTSGLDGTSMIEPAIPTGRIPADSADNVGVYLNKLKEYFSPDNQYQEWQKNVLHLGGGATTDQTNIIRGRLDNLRPFVLNDPFSGVVTTFSKAAIGEVDPNFKDQILKRINEGTSLVTFLGHGSTSVTDIDIGRPETYQNIGKYPVFYFNGCQVGNPCVPGSQAGLGERIFSGDRKGGIAFIGQTSLSELYTVSSQMRSFYINYFDTVRNKSVGGVLKKTINHWQNLQSPLNQIHCRQLFLQGDPAVPVYNPDLPDFATNDQSVFIAPENAYALMDSFSVAVVVRNIGRGVKDSFNVDLQWVYPDGVTKRNYTKRVRISGFSDTVLIRVSSKDALVRGDNLFIINLNQERNPTEYTYANNQAYYKRYIPGNGVNLVSPKNFAIIGRDSVELVAQGGDIFKQNEDYFFELDTTPNFNSPLLISLEKQGKPMNRAILAKYKVKLPILRDTQVYFWRARISTSVKEGGGWQLASFTYIRNHPDGWMQNIHWQYVSPASKNIMNTVYSDSASRHLKFKKILKKIYIDCQYNFASNKGVKESGFGSQDLNFGVCRNGIVCIPWNGRKLVREPIDPAIIQPDCFWGRAWKLFGNSVDYQLYYVFQMDVPSEQDQFIKFINALPDSNYVTIYCRNQSYAHTWKPEVMQALNKIGSAVFDTAARRTADAMWVCLGKKGWHPGQAQENHTYGSVQAYVSVEGDMLGDARAGSMTSELIGPSNRFQELRLRPVLRRDGVNEYDEFFLTIYGVDTGGKTSVIRTAGSENFHDLTTVNTRRYTYLYLKADVRDELGNTSPNLVNWRVTMDPAPEGSLYPDPLIGYKFYRDTLYEGDTLNVALPFRNISKLRYRDSILVEYSIIHKTSRRELERGTFRVDALQPDSFYIFRKKLATTGLAGQYAVQIAFNPRFTQPEQTMSNNSAILNFYVQKDIMNPLLDVTFDGRHIVNGEIVSANPFILISSKDENRFLLQQDTQHIEIMVKKPGGTDFEPVGPGEAVFFAAADANNKARVEYRPKDLPEGTYILKVQSWDQSKNKAGANEYEISFNVVREQSVTQFYPYPNPFTTNMRFVFTLTGTRVPDEIRIKIMNAEGKVVKEVSKEELGPIRVGNNITEWSWDGTDQFGDRLANGTYFYKVIVRDAGEDLKIRETKGDASFREQVGTIYLLR